MRCFDPTIEIVGGISLWFSLGIAARFMVAVVTGNQPESYLVWGFSGPATALFLMGLYVVYEAIYDRTVKRIRMLDVQTGAVRLKLQGHVHGVRSVAFSPHGKTLASVSWDNTIRLWETDTGKEILTKKIKEWVDSVFFSGGVPLAMAYSDRDIRLWAVTTGKSVLNLKEEGRVNSVALSPDGRLLASDVGRTAFRIWNVATGKAIHELNIDEWSVNCVAFSPDSKVLASGESRIVENSNGVGYAIRLWDLESGKELCLLEGHRGRIKSVAFSFDGKTLASAGDDETVRLWNVTTGRQLHKWKAQVVSASHVVFSPDGRTVAAAGFDGSTHLWDVATGKERWNVWTDGESLAFSPDGRTLAVGW